MSNRLCLLCQYGAGNCFCDDFYWHRVVEFLQYEGQIHQATSGYFEIENKVGLPPSVITE